MTAAQWKRLKRLTNDFNRSRPSLRQFSKMSLEEKIARQNKKAKKNEEEKRRQARLTNLAIHDADWLWTFNFKLMFGEDPFGREKLERSGYSFRRLRKAQPGLVREIEAAFKRKSKEANKYIAEHGPEEYINKGQFELDKKLEKEVGSKLHKLYIFLRRRGVTNEYLL